MRQTRTTFWLASVFLLVSLFSASCGGIRDTRALPDGHVDVPDDIIQDLLAFLSSSTLKIEPGDLRWEVYSVEESRRVVGATFRGKDREGQDCGWYCLMVYGPRAEGRLPERMYCAIASIDDPDFDVAGVLVSGVRSPHGASAVPTLVAAGLASDTKVAKVILETSEGRSLEASVYSRFWLLASDAASGKERVTKAIGYSEDGTKLYLHYVFPEGHPNQVVSLEARIHAGLSDPDPLICQAWSMIQASIERSEEDSRRIFAEDATRFTNAEIRTLQLADIFEDPDGGSDIEVYLLKYRMLPEDPSKVFLPGGMTIRDGWLLSQSSMGEPYFVARRIGDEVSYLGTMYPGSKSDIRKAILRLLSELER